MGYHLTLEKTPNPRQKNASGEIFSGSGECTRKTTPQPQTLPRKNDPTPTTTASGVFYYGYRYYNPATGKWPSRDPLGERGGVNLYAFVMNNSINKVDYLGLEVIDTDPVIEHNVDLILDAVEHLEGQNGISGSTKKLLLLLDTYKTGKKINEDCNCFFESPSVSSCLKCCKAIASTNMPARVLARLDILCLDYCEAPDWGEVNRILNSNE